MDACQFSYLMSPVCKPVDLRTEFVTLDIWIESQNFILINKNMPLEECYIQRTGSETPWW